MFPTVQLKLRPGIIDLGWGHPDPKLLPVSAIEQAARAALQHYGPDALGYGAERGPGPLLKVLQQQIASVDGRAPALDELLITGGASQALDQLCTLITQPGDVLLVESPTYHLAVRIMREHPLKLVAVARDEQGVLPEALRDTLRSVRQNGQRVAFLYTIPTFHNPTGSCASLERRRALVALAEAEDLLILEDDVYRELGYDTPVPPSLWSLAEEGRVVRLGSFSKTLAPGLRLGWMSGSRALTKRCVTGGLLDSGGGVNQFVALLVASFWEQGSYQHYVNTIQTTYRARRDALLEALRLVLPEDCTIHPPAGGFFVWITLPPEINADSLLPHAEALGVSYLPGARFQLGEAQHHTLRLSFSLYPEAELHEATVRLGRAIAQQRGTAP